MHLIHDPGAPAADPISFADVLKVDIRAGTIVEATTFAKAIDPSYRLGIDFGPVIGIRRSVARITERYAPDVLVGRRVLAVVNLPPRQIADTHSEVLVLGLPDASGAILLITGEREVPDGARVS